MFRKKITQTGRIYHPTISKRFEIAAEKGLILVDTKYEFGKVGDQIYLIDEIHTPDSSRYFYADEYEERFANGEPQKQLSKEFVREWLMDNGFQGQEGQKIPEMTDEFVKVFLIDILNYLKRLQEKNSIGCQQRVC